MNRCLLSGVALSVVVVISGSGPRRHTLAADGPRKTVQAWTLDDARAALRLSAGDPYLQYVALQLARGEGRADKVAAEIRKLTRRRGRGPEREVDLFALFTGALAVQESLQLDAMQVQGRGDGDFPEASKTIVPVGSLIGPTVRSHPWGKMLAAQTLGGPAPEVSPLALCVPEDQYLVLFGSVRKLLEANEQGDLWGAHLLSQAAGSARSQQTSARLMEQLAVQTDPLTRPFYDMVVDEMALTGSDLYLRAGSDVTMLFTIRQPELFLLRMDGFLTAAEQSHADAERTTGKILGVEYVHVGTPDRSVHVYSAYPREDLHVRSNSKAAIRRVLETIVGRKVDGRGKIRPLGDATEFKYIRTLMPRGADEEHGFVYLSDPFIRRVVGPELKLTNRRRMLCYNHLRMIGHAAMLFRTQYGRAPKSLEELAAEGCVPGVFGSGNLRCPCGGAYELSSDGSTGTCTHHGHARNLVPCCEISLDRVTQGEADEYRRFVERYSRFWRKFFDPIAVRLQITPGQYRAETIILPLIDNSIYSGMAMSLGGEPEPLDALPVPQRNIFSIAVRVNKEALLASGKADLSDFLFDGDWAAAEASKPDAALTKDFLTHGIGNQIGMHVYDAAPTFDFNLTGFLGDMLGQFRGRSSFIDDEMLYVSFLVASLNAPVYVSVPVEEAEIVDRFLDQLDSMLATLARKPSRGGWFDVDFDFYRVPLEGADERIRAYSVQFGPVKWRVFFARIGDGLYLASKRFILEDLAALEAGPDGSAKEADQQSAGPAAHAMVRLRPEHWDEVLGNFRLGWAESSRNACLDNLGPLSSVARAMTASKRGGPTGEAIHRQADALHGVHFFCPDGGRYELAPDGRQITCSVHGTALTPRQPTAPSPKSPMGRLMDDFGGATATLTFLEDGLHAVVTIDRK